MAVSEYEQGSDAMLPADYDPAAVVAAAEALLAEEEQRVRAVVASRREPGEQHPDPDETPPLADAPDYDPLPPPAA